jgi:hypothetical protein
MYIYIYDCVAVLYNPVHPFVQDTAGTLIECLKHKDDLNALFDAESFAQVTFNNLKDPANRLNQESKEVADGYYKLGTAISQQCKMVQNGDLENMTNQLEVDLGKAEMLAKESLRIRSLL